MEIVCLDLEGVLVPEIWIAFAEETGIPELKRTTRDEPDYDKLMKYRLNILKEHGLGLKEIQETIAKIDPIPGAKEFLDKNPKIKAELEKDVRIKEIKVERVLPSKLKITIEEEKPFVKVKQGEKILVANEQGEIFSYSIDSVATLQYY